MEISFISGVLVEYRVTERSGIGADHQYTDVDVDVDVDVDHNSDNGDIRGI